MNNKQQVKKNALELAEKDIYKLEDTFNAIKTVEQMNFKKECEFALQLLKSNEYLLQIASTNPESLEHAIKNVAAVGLSLNPAKKSAYLVPRDGKVCLDVSYYGMKEVATTSGSVVLVKARIIRENDTFEYQGLDKEPIHSFKPFDKKRGEIVGVFCAAKTIHGDWISDHMLIEEVHKIRDRNSKSYINKPNSSPWKSDYEEMVKKTMIRRAAKEWPRFNNDNRVDNLVQVMDEVHGVDFEKEQEEFNKKQQEELEKGKKLREEKAILCNEIKKTFDQKIMEFDIDMNAAGELMHELCKVTNINDIKRHEKALLEEILLSIQNYVPKPISKDK